MRSGKMRMEVSMRTQRHVCFLSPVGNVEWAGERGDCIHREVDVLYVAHIREAMATRGTIGMANGTARLFIDHLKHAEQIDGG